MIARLVVMIAALFAAPVAPHQGVWDEAMPAPANDSCASATVISSLPYSATQDTTEATPDSGTNTTDPTPSATTNTANYNTVWFEWTAPTSDDYIVSAHGYDIVLSIWTGACGSLSEVDSHDNENGLHAEQIQFAAVSGTTYRFMASSFNPGGGSLSFSLSVAGATVLTSTRLQATAVDLAWGGALGPFKLERCTGPGCTSWTTETASTDDTTGVVAGLTPGTTYRFRVQGLNPSPGAFSNILEITTPNDLLRQVFFPAFDTGSMDDGPVLPFDNDVVAGSLLIAAFQGWGDRTLTSVTDSQGNTWARAFREIHVQTPPNVQHPTSELWYAIAGTSGPCTVTFAINTVSSAGLGQYVIAEFTPGAASFDVAATLASSGTVVTHPVATSGSQTSPGLMIALCSLDTSAGGGDAFVPSGFDYFASNSSFRYTYRRSVTAESFVGVEFSGYPFASEAACGIASFAVTEGEPPPPRDPLVNNSVPCCHDGDAGGGGGGQAGDVLGPPDTAPLPEWTPRCVGGGVYPAGTPVVHSEDWTA